MTKHKFVIYLITWWSGFFVMGLELLGGRTLAPFFGTGIYVWGAIITLFMLSLSIGYLLGGHLSERQPSLLKLSATLLLATMASLPCASASNVILERIFEAVPDPRYGALLSSIALFFLPITISGAISPYAIR
ncbi:MAG: fused MFS/spermidine synthase, partial [Magnetococcales bacterium]|nr:fused MFS/spermidine synthase [Magnetococcales bacterium]